MSKTINNLVNHIEIVHGTNEKETIPKLGLRTIIQEDRIILISPSGGSGTTSVRQSVTFEYTDVVTPSTSSAEELRDIILAWVATGKAGEDLVGIAPSYIGKNNGTNADFTVTRTSATVITLSAFSSDITQIYESDIEVIRHCSAAGVLIAEYTHTNSTINDNGSSVITVTEAAFGATDLFVVFTNIPKPSGGGGGGGIAPDFKIGSWDGAVTYASTTTVTLAGSYPTINSDSQVIYIKVTDDTLETAEIFRNGINGVYIKHSGGTLTIYGAGTPFASTNVYEVSISAPPVGSDLSQDVNKVSVRNPSYGHYTDPEPIILADLGLDGTHDEGENQTDFTDTSETYTAETVAEGYLIYNVTDGADALIDIGGAGNPSTDDIDHAGLANGGDNDWDTGDVASIPECTRKEINVESYPYFSIHYKIASGANNTSYFKIYASNNADADVTDETDWVDVSERILANSNGWVVGDLAVVTVADAAQEDIIFIDTKTIALKFMIKAIVECSNGIQDNDFEFYVKKGY